METKRIEFPKLKRKTAIIALNTRYSPFHDHIRAREILWLRQYLTIAYDREVDIVGKLLKNEHLVKGWKELFTTDLNEYDEIIIQNCTHNYFGGVVNDYICEAFNKLANWKGEHIWYHYWDCNLGIIDFGQNFKKKLNKLKFVLPVTEQTCDKFSTNIFPKIKCLYNGKDYESLYKFNKEALKEYAEFDLPLFWCANILKERDTLYTEKKFDIMYYGNKKGSSRLKVLNSLFKKDNELTKCFWGYDPEYPNTHVEKKYILLEDLYNEIEKSWSVINVGDKSFYEGKCYAMRVIESLNLDTIAFIHKPYVDKDFLKNIKLASYILIENIDDIKRTLNLVKSNPELYKQIIIWQREEFKLLCNKYKLDSNKIKLVEFEKEIEEIKPKEKKQKLNKLKQPVPIEIIKPENTKIKKLF